MIRQGSEPRRFTGWKMLAVTSLFFGTIIFVNFVMAWNASRSWSGVEVENAYIASQQFNGKLAEARTFEASGIKGELTVKPDALHYVLTRESEPEPTADEIVAILKRPVEEHEDIRIELTREGEGVFVDQALKPGRWIAEVRAMASGALVYHQAIHFIAPGEDR